MFDLSHNVSDPVYLVVSVLIVWMLCGFDLKKVEDQLRLFVHCSQMRHQGLKSRSYAFLRANPFPHVVGDAFAKSYAAVYTLINMLNGFSKCIARTNAGCEDIRGRRLLIETNTSVAFDKSSKPSEERFFGCNGGWSAKKLSINLSGFFQTGDSMNCLWANFPASNARGVLVVDQDLKLSGFYKTMRDKLTTKLLNPFGTQIPTVNRFMLASRFFINDATKSFFEKVWDKFASIVQANLNRSSWRKGDTSFSVKHSSVVFHMVILYSLMGSPATTKFEGARINSSLCHSLNFWETWRGGSEAFLPPRNRSVGVEPESNRLPNQNSTLEPEYGSVANSRFLLSPIASVSPGASALGADVYNTFFTGRESYCMIDQESYGEQFVYRPPILNDALGLNASVGWKMAFSTRITNDAWVINLRSTLA